MVGGTTLGYWALGNCRSETRPISTITMARTFASTGRSMKKREIMAVRPEGSFGRRVRWGRRRRGPLRIDLGSGESALNPLGHHPVLGIEPGFDDPELAIPVAGFHDSPLNDVVRADYQDIAPLLARPDRVVRRQHRVVQTPHRGPHAHE